MMVKGQAVQMETKCFTIFYRLLPMIIIQTSRIEKWWVIGGVWKGGGSVFQDPSEASELLLRPAKYIYHVELPNSATRGAAVMPAVCPAAQI
jgi:hypothetical protein